MTTMKKRNETVEANLGLVHGFLKRHPQYCYNENSVMHGGFSYDDAFQSATIGLMKAIESYDETKCALSTWAEYFMLHSLIEDFSNTTGIKIPENKYPIRMAIRVTIDALEEKNELPTLEKIAEALPDVRICDIVDLLPYSNGKPYIDSIEEIAEIEHEAACKTGYGKRKWFIVDDPAYESHQERVSEKREMVDMIKKALTEVFSVREINILMVYNENGKKIADAKRRLAENYGYYDITEDEIRRTWGDAANRISQYILTHPETEEYLGHFVKLYINKTKSFEFEPTDPDDDPSWIADLWNDTVTSITDDTTDMCLTLSDLLLA